MTTRTRGMGKADVSPIRAGDRFGRLTALSSGRLVQLTRQRQRFIPVRCDCGNEKEVRAATLKAGLTVSCGCYARDNAAILAEQTSLKHGHSRSMQRTPEYGIWCTMRNRCYNPNVERYPLYGGRGIQVCDRWLGDDGYANFISDMGHRPEGFSIEREDQNGNYEPGNCRWASAKDQANNTRRNRILEHGGRAMTLAQWSEEIGIKPTTIHQRIKSGWTVAEALTRPLRGSI